MRIGCVYSPRPNWPKWNWVERALSQLGHEAVSVTSAAQLAPADETCDFLLLEHRDCGIGWRVLRDYVRNVGKKSLWIQWWFDLIAQCPNVTLEQQATFQLCCHGMRLCDAVLVKERDLVDQYRDLEVNAYYCDQGCPSWYPQVSQHEAEFDVLVFGRSETYRERTKAVIQLASAGFHVGWATSDPQIPVGVTRLPWTHPEQLPALMSRAACVLCCDYRNDVNGYWSDRDWLVKGAGAIPLRPQWTGRMTFLEAVEYITRASPAQRHELGAKFRDNVMREHTYEHRLRDIVAFAEGLRNEAIDEDLQDLSGYGQSRDHAQVEVSGSQLSGL